MQHADLGVFRMRQIIATPVIRKTKITNRFACACEDRRVRGIRAFWDLLGSVGICWEVLGSERDLSRSVRAYWDLNAVCWQLFAPFGHYFDLNAICWDLFAVFRAYWDLNAIFRGLARSVGNYSRLNAIFRDLTRTIRAFWQLNAILARY